MRLAYVFFAAVSLASIAFFLIPRVKEAPIEVAEDGSLLLPSGLSAYLHEMLWDRPGGGLVYRFRFVAEDFTGKEDFEKQSEDLEFLCNDYAIDKLADIGPKPSQIVISLADKPSEFGKYEPDVEQIFESFSVEDGACIWDIF